MYLNIIEYSREPVLCLLLTEMGLTIMCVKSLRLMRSYSYAACIYTLCFLVYTNTVEILAVISTPVSN